MLVSISDIASLFGMSPATFKKEFIATGIFCVYPLPSGRIMVDKNEALSWIRKNKSRYVKPERERKDLREIAKAIVSKYN
ncbi:MAG: hypothetical protein C4539_07435 [Ignavibacteriales bacterium]|nr:MAG: hypothetical protein C4539_07435 [Ignavibacteriales bacterium]